MTPAPRLAFPAMLVGSICLAFGPWLVRLADVAPLASAFWRVGLAVVPLLVIAGVARAPLKGLSWGVAGGCTLAALCFAGDLAVWHLGIARTTLANATLLANAASFLLPLFGYLVSRTLPGRTATLALIVAATGTALLLGRSADVSPRHFAGDLLCLAAAVLYTGYLVLIDRARRHLAPMTLLALATLVAAVALLPLALATGGAFWPRDWTPVALLALGSQVVGQGLIVYAVGHLRPLVVGLTLLVQPAIAATIGAFSFGEIPGPVEIAGAALVVVALLLVRLPERR